jgi:1-aminocyclopropane-1-carboxylate deaminase/D-cysteine desulfhydrase-like pyridoxal-dependent ACC family enzyme
MMTKMVINASTTAIVDLIDMIIAIIGPIIAVTTGIDVIIAATIDATTTVAMTVTTSVMTTWVIAVMTSATITDMTNAMINVARTTTIATTTIRRMDSTATAQRGQPQWCVPEGQP